MRKQIVETKLPHGFYQSAREWRNASGNYGMYQEFFAGHELYTVEPKRFEASAHWKFRRPDIYMPPAYVSIIPGGRVWGPNGTVITPDNKLLADVSIEFRPVEQHSVFQQKQLPAIKYTTETVAVLASAGCDNYFHWLFDILPRIDLLCRSGIQLDRVVINQLGSFHVQIETLSILGVPLSILIACSNSFHLAAKTLVVPSLPGIPGNPPKWACEFLRRKLLHNQDIKPIEGYERIYISRANANARKVINENKVVDSLGQFGFKSVKLETMPIIEQVQLFLSAQVVVAPHGAGLANLVFCKPKTKVIEFFSPNYVNVCFWTLSNQVDLDYYYLIGEGDQPPEYIDPHIVSDNIRVNIDALLRIIRLAGINEKS